MTHAHMHTHQIVCHSSVILPRYFSRTKNKIVRNASWLRSQWFKRSKEQRYNWTTLEKLDSSKRKVFIYEMNLQLIPNGEFEYTTRKHYINVKPFCSQRVQFFFANFRVSINADDRIQKALLLWILQSSYRQIMFESFARVLISTTRATVAKKSSWVPWRRKCSI